MLCLLGLLAGLSVLASGLGTSLAWALAIPVTGYGLHLARCERRKSLRTLVIAGRPAVSRVDGQIVEFFTVQWRGPIAFVAWLEPSGRRERLVWWPDTLPRHARRELRLAAAMLHSTPRSQSMAP